MPFALLATDRDGHLAFAGPAILNPPLALRAAWRERVAALEIAKPPVRGLRQGAAEWLRPTPIEAWEGPLPGVVLVVTHWQVACDREKGRLG